MQQQFQLDKSSKKHICPACQKKTFVAYVYTDNQQPVDPLLFGRCDRENNCGHFHSPNDNEEFKPRPVQKVISPKVEQIFPGEDLINPILNRTKTAVSPLHKWARSKTITTDHLLKWGIYSEGNNGETTTFLFINREGKVCNLKRFRYKEDGHRDKNFNSFSLKQPPAPKPVKEGEEVPVQKKYFLCLFGEHLLDPSKQKIVIVVESEKSAAIASFFYPQFDWVACGSAQGLSDGSNDTANKIAPLMNRRVIWLADADKAGRANKSIRNLESYKIDYQVLDLFPERNDGYDIGDAIADGLRPSIKWLDDVEQAAEEKRAKSAVPLELEWHMLYDWPVEAAQKKEKFKSDVENYGLFMTKNKIYISRTIKGKREDFQAAYFFDDITNFSIKSLGHISSKTDPRRLLNIRNIHGKSLDIELPTKAFTSEMTFCEIIEGQGNFTFDGNKMDLKRLRRKLYDEMKSFEEVEALGWHHKGFMIWSNGISAGSKFYEANDYGFVEFGENRFYLPALSKINDNDEGRTAYDSERKFVLVQREDISFKTWAAMFVKVHKKNGEVALAWFMASLFRDFIYQIFKFFPHLFLFGPPGTGKSQVAWSIRPLGFNGTKKPFMLSGGTKVAFHREFSHFTNFPCWFDEYDNNIDWDRIQALKAAYDGAGHTKSIKDSDSRTKTVPVNSSCVISGQQMPIADVALFKRVMLCQFYQTEFSAEEQDALKALQGMEAGGLSFITAGLMRYRKQIEENFMATFTESLKEMEALNEGYDVEDRIMRNYVICLAVFKVLEEAGLKKGLPFTSQQLKLTMLSFMNEQMTHIKSSNETNTFWDMVSYLLDAGLIAEGTDFMVREENSLKVMIGRERQDKMLPKRKPVLYLRFSKIIPLYKENFKRQNSGTATPMDKNSLKHYLQHSKEFLGSCDNVRFANSVTSAYAFDYEMLKMKGVVDLDRGANQTPMAGEEAGGAGVTVNW